MKDSTGADLQHVSKTEDALLGRVAVVLPIAQATSGVGNREKSAVVQDAPVGVALATAEETTEEIADDTSDILATVYAV